MSATMIAFLLSTSQNARSVQAQESSTIGPICNSTYFAIDQDPSNLQLHSLPSQPPEQLSQRCSLANLQAKFLLRTSLLLLHEVYREKHQ